MSKSDILFYKKGRCLYNMVKKSWYFVFVLSLLLIFIQLSKLMNIKFIDDSIDIALGLITGLGLLIASYIKIKSNKEK